MFFCPRLPPVVFGVVGWGLAVFTLSGYQGPAAGLGSLWGKDDRGPAIGRLCLRQGAAAPDAFDRLDPGPSPASASHCFTTSCDSTLVSLHESKKHRKKIDKRRAQTRDGVAVSGTQGTTPSSPPNSLHSICSPPLDSLLVAETGDRLHLGWTSFHRPQTSGHCSKSPSSRPS